MNGHNSMYNLLMGNAPVNTFSNSYNALGRTFGASPISSSKKSNNSSDDNFFEKTGKSFENAFGTTGAALYETGGDLLGATIAGLTGGKYESAKSKEQREKQENAINDYNEKVKQIYKDAGYQDTNQYEKDKDEAMSKALASVGFDLNDYWNKRGELALNDKYGDSDAIKALDRSYEDAKSRLTGENAENFRKFDEIEQKFRDASNAQSAAVSKNTDAYDDYTKNNYASQKINQDRGKFAGSAINTLSTMFDVMAPGAGVLANSIQGGIGGIADELEQNGLENFDWERAGQNALAGATVGAVTGGLNKGISSNLAKKGGNLFKGGNAITRGLNNLGSSTTAGRIGSTLATGAARGAVSGAVGGATGAGLSAAMNGQDVLGSAIQGAQQGFGRGAMTGSIMAGANMAANATPGVGDMMRKFNESSEDWNARKANGESFGERLSNTWDDSTTKAIGDKIADSKLGQRIGEDVNAVKQGFQNVGEGLKVLANRSGVLDSLQNIGMSVKNVADTETIPQDIQNMRINNPYDDANYNVVPKEDVVVQRVETPQSNVMSSAETEPFMAYGNSDLASGKVQKQNILSKAGRAMQAAQSNATRKETRDIGIESSGELINKVRQRTGLSDLEKQASFAKELTGGDNSLLDRIQSNAIASTEDGSTRSVDLTSLEPKINKLVDDAPNTLISPSKKEEVKSAILADLRNGGIDTIRKANNFKSAGSQQFLINERTPNDSAKELGKLYMKVGDMVDEASYAQIPQSQVEAMFDVGANEARARAQVAANKGQKEYEVAYNRLADELDASPKTIPAFRNIKKDYVDISKLNKKTQQGATAWNNNPLTMGTAITAAMATGNPFAAVPAAWAAKTFAPAIGQAAIDTSAKLGGKLADWGDNISARKSGDYVANTNADVIDTSNYNPNTRIYDIIGRSEGLSNAEQARTADYLINAAQEAEIVPNNSNNTLESLVSQPTTSNGTSVYNSLYGGNNQTQSTTAKTPTTQSSTQSFGNGGAMYNNGLSYYPQTGDYWTDIIGIAMTNAINDEDYSTFGALYEMYQSQLANLQKQSSNGKDYSNITNWNSSDRSKLLSAQDAMSQIDQLESAYNNATGGQGGNVLQGNLRSLAANISGGNLDASANNYNKLAESVGMGIVKNLINLGVTEADAKRYLEYLPSLTDTKEQASQKLATLRNIYQSQINNLYSAYGI